MANPKTKGGVRTRRQSAQAKNVNILTAVDVMKIAINAGFSLMSEAPNPRNPGEKIETAILATAVAFAENTKFDPFATNTNDDGSIDTGLWMINSVHQKTHPEWTVANLKDTNTNARAALEISGGGQNWKPWYAVDTDRFLVGLKLARAAAKEIVEGFTDDRLGVVDEENLGAVFGIAGWIAAEVGKASAKWFLGAVTWVGKILYDEVVHPQWEHAQRATVYYYEEIMSSKKGENQGFYYDYAGVVTVAFWSLGYALLWRDADNGSAVGADVDRTAFGKMLRSAQTSLSSRKLHKPKDAAKQTPKKPKPKVSTTETDVVRYAKVKRKRAVDVAFGNAEGEIKTETETPERTPENV